MFLQKELRFWHVTESYKKWKFQVDVSPTFSEIRVFWLAKGDETDKVRFGRFTMFLGSKVKSKEEKCMKWFQFSQQLADHSCVTS